MRLIELEIFRGQTLELTEDVHYRRCHFEDCTLIEAGAQNVRITDCEFLRCYIPARWLAAAAAADNTIEDQLP